MTTRILERCRLSGFSPSTIFPVLSQLATARLLHRRYYRGEISEDEWEYRRRQPMHFFGHVNLRPYLDAEWRRKGGGQEGLALASTFVCTLPFMPSLGNTRSSAVELSNGAPPFSVLLGRDRFLLRCRMFKKQMDHVLKHPLYLDMAELAAQRSIALKKTTALHWKDASLGRHVPDKTLPTLSIFGDGQVMSNSTSSGGNVSVVSVPPNHEIDHTHSTIWFFLASSRSLPITPMNALNRIY